MWLKPNIHTAFSVASGPAIAVCNGYSGDGLPLSMQIAGAPFDEQQRAERGARLRTGDAMARAAAEARSRDAARAGDSAVALRRRLDRRRDPGSGRSVARRAGLNLNDAQFTVLCEVAPYALAMGARIARNHDWTDEPADVFRPRATA